MSAFRPGLLFALTVFIFIGSDLRADVATTAPTDPAALVEKLAGDDSAVKKQAIDDLAHSRDMRLIPFFQAYTEGSVYQYNGHVVLGLENQTNAAGEKVTSLLDPLTREPVLDGSGKPLVVPVKLLKDASAGRRERLLVRDAVNLLRLSDPDRTNRLNAVIKSGDNGGDTAIKPLTELLKTETDNRIIEAIHESIDLLNIQKTLTATDPDSEKLHLAAVKELGDNASSRSLSRLVELAKKPATPQRAAAYATAIGQIKSWQTKAEWVGNLFSGLSAGSVLILLALGLSIIFGLMGVINMAQGEFMMLGAYATYECQRFFLSHCPGAFNWYFVVAIPVSFLVAAAVGWLVEVLVIRHLYGRPLDTLLATWGIGLILTQAVRWHYGDNIGVNSPSWLVGGFEVARDITFPYNRCFIMLFCVLCIVLMYAILDRTRLGLLIRATTQNRPMAASLGVSTRRIDGATFALGTGLAGLAGCALTLIGGVTPDMGQNYIVDAFMVVVTGGVGKLSGAVIAGTGLGCLNKLLEPLVQTVWAKVLILLFVIAFIQKRPSGLFPAKGRLADV